MPDGVIWITIGKEGHRSYTAHMREVIIALGEEPEKDGAAFAWQRQYRELVAGKSALIVLDDVWSKADLEPLLVKSPTSKFLFTTRDAAIAHAVNAREHKADLLDDPQARELLAAWAGRKVNHLPPASAAILEECAGLPLALAMVGAMLRGQESPTYL